MTMATEKDLGVTIVEQYSVGEYDILILSAEESNGLETWLKREGYKIPDKGRQRARTLHQKRHEVLCRQGEPRPPCPGQCPTVAPHPDELPFGEVHAAHPPRHGQRQRRSGNAGLWLCPEGRIETANYRTVPIPTDTEIPNNLKPRFDQFYGDLFERAWQKAGKNAVMLEYAWNLSAVNPVKCDPCNGPPPIYADMREAGVFWINATNTGYTGEVYFTRLHVKYNRETFPQDLMFQATPNRQNFQGRYVMRHPAGGEFSCDAGQQYLKGLHQRREKEVYNLNKLTGWNVDSYDSYVSAYDHLIKGDYQPYFGPLPEDEDKGVFPIFKFNFPSGGAGMILLLGLGLLGILLLRKIHSVRIRRLLPLTMLLIAPVAMQAFCGFYVARADAKLFNKRSSVILVRDGNQTTVTMSSDFEGEVKDFALVIPVPKVLEREQIKIVNNNIFDKLDAYSGPRLVEYHDPYPCRNEAVLDQVVLSGKVAGVSIRRKRFKAKEEANERQYHVQVVESYTVGEYDIVILSAKESDGLERWLTDHGYKIPSGAGEVLQPYIKSKLKFFVVKVNLENYQRNGFDKLRPIQITYRSNRFMLPIRLGMANANGDQDMIVYAFTPTGRIETTNYRTVPMPSNWNIPNDLRHNFGAFYKSAFDKAWQNAGQNSVMLEYAWDLSGINPVKCDPCNGPPPVYFDLQEAGVDWLRPTKRSYAGSVFMTRLHVRYNRETFPQDLMFQVTPDKEKFQCRYVMNQPPPEIYLSCEEGKKLARKIRDRREGEVANLATLTDWPTDKYQSYIHAYDHFIGEAEQPYLGPLGEEDDNKGFLPVVNFNFPGGPGSGGIAIALLLMAWMLGLVWLRRFSLRLSRIALPLSFMLLLPLSSQAFCGFYVAKADAKLFNKASTVIIARQGTQTVITMSSDFQGPVKDFAMVVPVPVVLKKSQIRLADQSIFDKLDAYSGPRLVEYHDSNPCEIMEYEEDMLMDAAPAMSMEAPREAAGEGENYGVTILESYSVGEYDILILSAEESGGLETWLTRNGYKIPTGAADVLEPYIKSDMKFFVVKVNLKKVERKESPNLRPIQMTFRSEKFMLPIRLGMANAAGDQDMIVYAFGENGRIETANYRTVEIPSNQNIPLPVQAKFGQFYKDLFQNAWVRNGKNNVLLEYAWDLSSSNYVKCDPCATTPPIYAELREAGVFWLRENPNPGWGGANYQGNAFMTRLHVRYNRETFPQDLMFQLTPNKQNHQGRYVLTHPATGDLSCEEGQNYIRNLKKRRQAEVDKLVQLTGWNASDYVAYVNEYDRFLKEDNSWFGPLRKDGDKNFLFPLTLPNWMWPSLLLLVFGLGIFGVQRRLGLKY
jgi:hypothetical protein